ncbi:hypothetical protein BC826DRAFT_1050477 [Russula brevipes]|nr:hypothetical protein BC826DRAFT_1050477 [Russula brevipes]
MCLALALSPISSHAQISLFPQRTPWHIVSEGMFALWEINRMEREVCSYLDHPRSLVPERPTRPRPPLRHGFPTQDSKRVGGGTHRVLATSGPHPAMVPALAPLWHPSAIPIPPTVAPRYS